jgi:hypothetical protein
MDKGKGLIIVGVLGLALWAGVGYFDRKAPKSWLWFPGVVGSACFLGGVGLKAKDV